jgi:ribosome modulation factor
MKADTTTQLRPVPLPVQAYDRGMRAHCDGQPKESCPYTVKEPKLREAWLRGWEIIERRIGR